MPADRKVIINMKNIYAERVTFSPGLPLLPPLLSSPLSLLLLPLLLLLLPDFSFPFSLQLLQTISGKIIFFVCYKFSWWRGGKLVCSTKPLSSTSLSAAPVGHQSKTRWNFSADPLKNRFKRPRPGVLHPVRIEAEIKPVQLINPLILCKSGLYFFF